MKLLEGNTTISATAVTFEFDEPAALRGGACLNRIRVCVREVPATSGSTQRLGDIVLCRITLEHQLEAAGSFDCPDSACRTKRK